MAYKMTHPASDLEIEVNAEQVATYESQGWETAPTVKSPTEDDSKKK
jgi:hypothetical protein